MTVSPITLCVQDELREQMTLQESSKLEQESQSRQSQDELSRKQEESVSSYKEQIRQHSVTICAMEERLNKVVKKNKDYQAEITQLKKAINGEARTQQGWL